MKRAAVCWLLAGCIRPQLPPVDPGVGGVALAELHPQLVLPGSELDLVGAGFADPGAGSSRLRLRGTFTPAAGGGQAVELTVDAGFVDDTHLRAVADARLFGALPSGAGHFDGDAVVLTDSPIDHRVHEAAPLPVSFDLAQSVTPRLDSAAGGPLFVNDAIAIAGDGFLLGGGEGETHAILSGCFLPSGASGACTPVADADLIVAPAAPWSRAQAQLLFAPSIAGIQPGTFTGSVRVENRPAGGAAVAAGSAPLTVTLTRPALYAVAPAEARLGQYVDVDGAGFAGAAPDEVTLLHLTGSFTRTGAPSSVPVDLKLVPHFSSGHRLRYVLDETDALGQIIDLRRVSGRFTGRAEPLVRKGTVEVVGDGAPVTIDVATPKQVIWVRFLPSYVDSLRLYGLGAADAQVRARVMAVAARDYAGVNVEFRSEEPADFALYSTVDVVGPDPNGLGLFGYDNTPGKDVGNQRLFDRIGGVNASTQSDGFPGYGGIFAEQFLGFSRHPSREVPRLPGDTPRFDQLFDPLRPESGVPATAAEVRAGIAASDGANCPADASDRINVLSCGVFVLGNLIGTTLTHEVGHSLGLADPMGELFHDPGDQPNRLMDAGDARPFSERAEIDGLGPGVFCDAEYTYLRAILANGGTNDSPIARPDCN